MSAVAYYTRIPAVDLPKGVRPYLMHPDERIRFIVAGLCVVTGEVVFGGAVRHPASGRSYQVRGQWSACRLARMAGVRTPLRMDAPLYAVADYLGDHGYEGTPIHRMLMAVHAGESARLLG